MPLKDHFCSSPWLHLKIDHDGRYETCRWMPKDHVWRGNDYIQNVDPVDYFQNKMSWLRNAMLFGEKLNHCYECQVMEANNKVSGRERQLLKCGITTDNFQKSTLSSPWLSKFKESLESNGETDLLPVDWHVALGNHCNSSCLYCHPIHSSKLVTEWKKLGLSFETPAKSWTENPEAFQSFINTLRKTTNLRYIHFMGGETLITPGFEDILDALIESNITNITIGFTTNLTVWDDDIIGKLSKFSEVHAGLSIECLHPVNDYVRYPSKLSDVKVILDRWVQIAQELNWLIQLRPTPTNLTIMYLDTLFEYAYTNNLAIESVNFINQPDFMRPSVLPIKTRNIISEKISKWINSKPESNNNVEVVNQRNPNYAKQQVINDAKSYLEYFKNQPDESEKLKDLVSRLKLLESNRKNSIMDYLPEYEELLRSAGY